MVDIFISYARKDEAFVTQLHRALAENGFDVWVDVEDIPLSAEWWHEIRKGIESANVFLFTVSPDSLGSEVCNWETAYAIRLNKKIIPILYRDVLTGDTLDSIERLKWETPQGEPVEAAGNWAVLQAKNLVFLDEDTLKPILPDLIRTIQTDLDHVEQHTRILVRANEWETHNHDPGRLLRGNTLNEAEIWLAESVDKDPTPTVVQTQYIRSSRVASTRRQRSIIGALTLGIVVTLALTFFALTQRQAAIDNETAAERRALESQSLAQVAYARQAVAEDDHSRALALALAANSIPKPPGLAQILLAERAYTPGALRIMKGPGHWVRQVAFSPDNKTILSTSDDDQVIVWNSDDEEPVRRYAARPGNLFTPDLSSVLFLRNEDHSLTLTDIKSGELLQRFKGHTDWVASAAFSPKGTYLAAGARGGAIIIWNVQSGERMHTIQLGRDTATSLAFNPDETAIAAGTEQGYLYLWKIETWKQKTFAGQHSGRISSIAFVPDGNHLVSGSFDTTVAMWALWGMKRQHTFTGHYGWVTSVAVSPDERMIISGGCGPLAVDEFCTLPGQVILWDIRKVTEMQQIDAYKQHTGGVFAVAFSPDSKRAVSSGTDRTVILWDVSKPEQLTNTQLQSGRVSSLALNPDTHEVLVGSGNNLVHWNLTKGESFHTYTGHEASIFSVALSPDGKQVLSGDQDGTVMLWDLGQVAAPQRVLRDHVDRVNSVAFSPDGRQALAAAEDGRVIYWNLESGDVLHTFSVLPDTALDLAFSPDGSYALSGLSGGNVLLWDLTSEATVHTLVGHTESVNSVTFSPDGRQALSSSTDTTLILWDVLEGTINHTLEMHERSVSRVVFSPAGTTAISGDSGGTLILWDLAMGEAVRVLREYDSDVQGLAFSADGTRLLSSSPYTQIVEWRIESLKTLRQWTEENRIIHAFTCQERELYGVQPPCETKRGERATR